MTTPAKKWWYLLRRDSYYPGVVASMGYDVWDWSTLNAGTLFQDSAKTTPASANGDVVGCWTDGVGGVDATQVTTANKPGLATASLGTLPTLSFDGGDLLATGNISISTFAVWIVRKITAGTIFLSHGNTSAVENSAALLSTQIRVKRDSGALYARKAYTEDASGLWSTNRFESNGTYTTLLLYKNNAPVSLTVLGDNADVGTGTATQPLYIGSGVALAGAITGNIAHLCIVSPYPTAQIIANMESYINGIWGIY